MIQTTDKPSAAPWQEAAGFVVFIGIVLVIRNWASDQFSDGAADATTRQVVAIVFNLVLVGVSIALIRKRLLLPPRNNQSLIRTLPLLLFPLYLLIFTLPDEGEVAFSEVSTGRWALLVVWVVSIGAAEELSLRGVVQSILVRAYGTSRVKVIGVVVGAAFAFGLLHLIKFDKGLAGELSQVAFATFIGAAFGALVLRTGRLWPVVVLHALIDFFANLDTLGPDAGIEATETTATGDAIALVIVTLPCLLYAVFLLRKKLPVC